jgi:hypothetical protein
MHATCPVNITLLDNNILREVSIMKLLIMHFSPTSYYFVPPRSKYLPPPLCFPSPSIFPHDERPFYTLIQKTGKIGFLKHYLQEIISLFI